MPSVYVQKGNPNPNEYPGYDIKLSDGEAPALENSGILITLSLSSLSGPLWPGVLAPDRVSFMGQTKQTVQTND